MQTPVVQFVVTRPGDVVLGRGRNRVCSAEAQVRLEVVGKVAADAREAHAGRAERYWRGQAKVDAEHQAAVVQPAELDVDAELGWSDLQNPSTEPMVTVPAEAKLAEEDALVFDPEIPDDGLPIEDPNGRIEVGRDGSRDQHLDADEWGEGALEERLTPANDDRGRAMVAGTRRRSDGQDFDERRRRKLLGCQVIECVLRRIKRGFGDGVVGILDGLPEDVLNDLF